MVTQNMVIIASADQLYMEILLYIKANYQHLVTGTNHRSGLQISNLSVLLKPVDGILALLKWNSMGLGFHPASLFFQ